MFVSFGAVVAGGFLALRCACTIFTRVTPTTKNPHWIHKGSLRILTGELTVSVYVDPIRPVEYGRWKYACHMIADTLDELHSMAGAIGMQRSWFQPSSFPHYDLLRFRREAAVKLGAVELEKRPFIHKLREIRDRGMCSLPPDC